MIKKKEEKKDNGRDIVLNMMLTLYYVTFTTILTNELTGSEKFDDFWKSVLNLRFDLMST